MTNKKQPSAFNEQVSNRDKKSIGDSIIDKDEQISQWVKKNRTKFRVLLVLISYLISFGAGSLIDMEVTQSMFMMAFYSVLLLFLDIFSE